MQRRVRVNARGGRGWWNTWCKCCSGLESLTCTEIWLLHTTLLLSAESKASHLKWNGYYIIVITYIYLYNNIS